MSDGEEEKPWKKRLRQLREHHEQQQALKEAEAAGAAQPGQHAQHAPGGPDQPTELQQQIVDWYRNTCLVAGAALVGSVVHWNYGGKQSVQVFVPPRAQSLPPDVVEGWKRSMRFKEGVRTVGRQTVFATGVAALYFGVELGARRWREADDWLNTAAAGAVAGGYLGSMLPGPSRARGAALGSVLGGAVAGASGLARRRLEALLPEAQQHEQQAALGGEQAGVHAGGSSREQGLVSSRPP